MIHELTSYLTSWFFGSSVFSQLCVVLLLAFVPLYIISHVGNAILRRRRKNNNPELWQYLDKYLTKRKPLFAVYINGIWGSGKTYFIKHYIASHNLLKMPCYLSLFGVSTREEFNFRMWKAILFTKIKIAILLSGLLFGGSMAIGLWLKRYYLLRTIEFWSFAVPIILGTSFFLWKFAHLVARDLMLNFRYLVLDDFERAEVDYPILMAWISELVEHRCCPVIIIGNELEIKKKLNPIPLEKAKKSPDNSEEGQAIHSDDSFAYAQYRRMKEKVVGKEFLLNQNDTQVITALAKGRLDRNSALRRILTSNIQWFVSVLLEPLHKNGIATNYRALDHVMHSFEWHFSGLDKFVENEKVWKKLIPRYFSLMYFKELGELRETKFDKSFLRGLFSGAQPETMQGNIFRECYPFWGMIQTLLSEYIWRDMVDNRHISHDALKDELDYCLNPKRSLMSRWHSVFELDDDELKSLINKTESDFRGHEKHYSPEEIFYIARVMLSVQDACGVYDSPKTVHTMFNDYIDREENNESFIKLMADDDNYRQQKRIVEMASDDHGNADDIRKHLLTAMANANRAARKTTFDELITVLQNKENLEEWFNVNNRKNIDIYSKSSPDSLWNALDGVSTVTFNKALDIFQVYLIDFNVELINLSSDGFVFWNNFVEIAKKRREDWLASKSNMMKNVRLAYFIEEVEPRLNQAMQHKNITLQGENNGQDEV